jgi:ArsR family transcriptional regulator, virulence genes transcriptional regulator
MSKIQSGRVDPVGQGPLEEMREHAFEAAMFLKTLANEQRLLILCALLEGEQNVGQLNTKVVLSPSALSQHLAWLREAEFVNTRRVSQTIYYRLADERVMKIMGVLKELFCP